MSTTYGELIRQVMLKLQPRADGITRLAVEQAINDAQKVISATRDFDELIELDTTHAFTVDGQKSYHPATDWLLVRPKDIYSIRLMSGTDSRKLTYVPFRKLDETVPYTEVTAEGKSTYYTQRGKLCELYPIPDAAYALYIQHSQWPTILVEDTDETDFEDIDYVITTLSADMALASLETGAAAVDWFQRAKQLLGIAQLENDVRPDRTLIAQPFDFSGEQKSVGEYWNNPWVKRQEG